MQRPSFSGATRSCGDPNPNRKLDTQIPRRDSPESSSSWLSQIGSADLHYLLVCSQKPQERPAGAGGRGGRRGLAATSQTGSASAAPWVAATKTSSTVKWPARWHPCHRPDPTRSAGGPSISKTRLRRHAHREWENRLSPPAAPLENVPRQAARPVWP